MGTSLLVVVRLWDWPLPFFKEEAERGMSNFSANKTNDRLTCHGWMYMRTHILESWSHMLAENLNHYLSDRLIRLLLLSTRTEEVFLCYCAFGPTLAASVRLMCIFNSRQKACRAPHSFWKWGNGCDPSHSRAFRLWVSIPSKVTEKT